MLTIRFSRIGTRKKPFFRIIISEKSKDTKGHYLELLGHFDPRTKQATLKADRIAYWLGLGATVSNSVYNLLVNHKIIHSDTKRRAVYLSMRRKAKLSESKQQSQEPAKEASPDAAPSPEGKEAGTPA